MCIQIHIFARVTCLTKEQILHTDPTQKCQSICNLSGHLKNVICDFNSLSINKSMNNKSSPQKRLLRRKLYFSTLLSWNEFYTGWYQRKKKNPVAWKILVVFIKFQLKQKFWGIFYFHWIWRSSLFIIIKLLQGQ